MAPRSIGFPNRTDAIRRLVEPGLKADLACDSKLSLREASDDAQYEAPELTAPSWIG
jgi:hypothetical protein